MVIQQTVSLRKHVLNLLELTFQMGQERKLCDQWFDRSTCGLLRGLPTPPHTHIKCLSMQTKSKHVGISLWVGPNNEIFIQISKIVDAVKRLGPVLDINLYCNSNLCKVIFLCQVSDLVTPHYSYQYLDLQLVPFSIPSSSFEWSTSLQQSV